MVPAVDAAINPSLAVPAVIFIPLGAAVQAVTDAGFEANDRGRSTSTGGATGEW